MQARSATPLPVLECIVPYNGGARLCSVLIHEVWQLDSSYKEIHGIGCETFELVKSCPVSGSTPGLSKRTARHVRDKESGVGSMAMFCFEMLHMAKLLPTKIRL